VGVSQCTSARCEQGRSGARGGEERGGGSAGSAQQSDATKNVTVVHTSDPSGSGKGEGKRRKGGGWEASKWFNLRPLEPPLLPPSPRETFARVAQLLSPAAPPTPATPATPATSSPFYRRASPVYQPLSQVNSEPRTAYDTPIVNARPWQPPGRLPYVPEDMIAFAQQLQHRQQVDKFPSLDRSNWTSSQAFRPPNQFLYTNRGEFRVVTPAGGATEKLPQAISSPSPTALPPPLSYLHLGPATTTTTTTTATKPRRPETILATPLTHPPQPIAGYRLATYAPSSPPTPLSIAAAPHTSTTPNLHLHLSAYHTPSQPTPIHDPISHPRNDERFYSPYIAPAHPSPPATTLARTPASPAASRQAYTPPLEHMSSQPQISTWPAPARAPNASAPYQHAEYQRMWQPHELKDDARPAKKLTPCPCRATPVHYR
jgi:hypothetical protein